MNQGIELVDLSSNVSSADLDGRYNRVFYLPSNVRSPESLDSRYNRVFGASIAIANRRLEILQWISPSVPWERHEDISNDRVDGVGQWFLQTDEFLKWRSGESDATNQVLFGYGSAGVGKTYLR